MPPGRGVAVVLLPLCLVACDREALPLEPCDAPAALDAPPPDALDLLFMVDNSNCTTREQAKLAEAMPELLRTLLSGEILDAEGNPTRAFPALRSVRIGFISSDMGAGGNAVPTCREPFGDDGRFVTFPPSSALGCREDPPLFLELTREPGVSDEEWALQVEDLAFDAFCMTEIGTDGCGFEQPLEAILKALTPEESPLRFQGGTRGQGDANRVEGRDPARFLRPDSVLAVVAMTDEDDCSVAEPELLDPSSERYVGDLNLRCFNYPEALHPVERYVDGLLALRPPERLVYATIAGVPARLGGADASAILAHPEMQEVVDEDDPTRLRTSCNPPGHGPSFPPRRMVSLAGALEARGAHVAIGSHCQEDFQPAIAPMLSAIADALEDQPEPACP
ncbi:MAG: hypothetical protein AAGH15_21985 [Myxococcota bacterium]